MTINRIGGLLLIASLSAHGATVTDMGDDVTFTYDDSTLFGAGTVVGNSIFFSPTSFRAESFNEDGIIVVTDTLNIVVEVKPESAGFALTDVAVAESGDYRLLPDPGSSSVDASGRLQVTSHTTSCGFFACTDAQIFTAGPLTVRGALTEWTADTMLALGDTGGWAADTKVTVQIQNNLTATSTVQNESAEIQKKSGGIGVVINPDPNNVVPVPAAMWLFGSALGLLGWLRRKAS